MSDATDIQGPIFRRHLLKLKLQDGVWFAYLTTEDDVIQLERSLAAANVKFSVRSSRKKPGTFRRNSI
ncbi:hypothetical protein MRX96_022334 [Rhipicephalus microplus]